MLKRLVFVMLCAAAIIYAKNSSASVSSIMVDAADGKVIYESNADELRYPASLTKLMTLYITFNALENKRLKLTDKLKVSRVAAGRSPSKLGVQAGTTITVKDAIMAVIVKSANDCATVLAEHFSKNEAEFAQLMTSTAKKLGMKHTTFKNASGLPNSKQKTTARDMSVLAMAVYHHFPQYYKWFSLQSFKYKGQTITGHNHILRTFKGADGMKTGYTAASGYNIVTSATRNGKRVIAVTMGHKYLNERDKRVSLIMDKGLSHMNKSGGVDVAALTKEINTGCVSSAVVANNNVTKQKASARSYATKSKAPQTKRQYATATTSGKYAVQIGSFSNYNRAKNYALQVKNKIARKYAVHDIKVEKVAANNGTLYRSKVVGFAKNDATKVCRDMKKNKQACIVVADNGKLKMARR